MELSRYSERAGREPLLSAEEEVALARVFRDPSLPQAKREAARSELVESNLRLVVEVAAGYRGASPALSMEDLVQEGTIGLLHAIERFDPDRGHRFSTVAVWWIRQAIERAIADKGRVIRIPVRVREDIRRLREARTSLARTLDREPRRAEIAGHLAWDGAKIERVEAADLPDAASLNAPAKRPGGGGPSGDGAELIDLIAGDAVAPIGSLEGGAGPHRGSAADPEEELLGKARAEALQASLDRLTPNQRYVIARRYGLEEAGGKRQSLQAVARAMGLSRHRVGQIQLAALQSLRQTLST